MIVYNMRYRGPYEYDKLVLNVFQYHNLILRLKQEMQGEDCKLKEFTDLVEKAGQKIEAITSQMMVHKEEMATR